MHSKDDTFSLHHFTNAGAQIRTVKFTGVDNYVPVREGYTAIILSNDDWEEVHKEAETEYDHCSTANRLISAIENAGIACEKEYEVELSVDFESATVYVTVEAHNEDEAGELAVDLFNGDQLGYLTDMPEVYGTLIDDVTEV